MPGLLDYVKGYQHGGSVDFDPYANTSQADTLAKLGITVDSDETGLLPTYDPMGADMARADYDLRGQSFDLQREALGLRGEALSDTLATERRGSTGSLFDLTKQIQQQEGGSGFIKTGENVQAMTNVRGDIVSRFGDVSADIGRRRKGLEGELSGIGIDEAQSYLNLQKDIYGEMQDYERELLSAIGDLGEDDWRFGTGEYTPPPTDPCSGQCSGYSPGTDAYSNCIQTCQEGGGGGITGTDCPPGYSYVNGRCQRDQT